VSPPKPCDHGNPTPSSGLSNWSQGTSGATAVSAKTTHPTTRNIGRWLGKNPSDHTTFHATSCIVAATWSRSFLHHHPPSLRSGTFYPMSQTPRPATATTRRLQRRAKPFTGTTTADELRDKIKRKYQQQHATLDGIPWWLPLGRGRSIWWGLSTELSEQWKLFAAHCAQAMLGADRRTPWDVAPAGRPMCWLGKRMLCQSERRCQHWGCALGERS